MNEMAGLYSPCLLRKEVEVKRSTSRVVEKVWSMGAHPAHTLTAWNHSANPILICYAKFLGNWLLPLYSRLWFNISYHATTINFFMIRLFGTNQELYACWRRLIPWDLRSTLLPLEETRPTLIWRGLMVGRALLAWTSLHMKWYASTFSWRKGLAIAKCFILGHMKNFGNSVKCFQFSRA